MSKCIRKKAQGSLAMSKITLERVGGVQFEKTLEEAVNLGVHPVFSLNGMPLKNYDCQKVFKFHY